MTDGRQPTSPQHGKLVLRLLLITTAMFGFGFALVPLYDVFCQVTGINGKTSDVASAVPQGGIDTDRTVTIEFTTSLSPAVKGKFAPAVNSMQVHPGEVHQINFNVTNLAGSARVAQAVPSVSPGLAANYLHKIECFCFNSQDLAAGQTAALPLSFYIDPELPDDINTLTLSYSLFDITPQAENSTL